MNVDIKSVKTYLDVAVKYLTSLDKSFPSAKKTMDKYKATPQDRQYVRLATNLSYNILTEYIRVYYAAAMSVARVAVGGASGGEYAATVKYPNKTTKNVLNVQAAGSEE